MPKVPHGRDEHPARRDPKWLRRHVDVQHDVAYGDDVAHEHIEQQHAEMHAIAERFHDRRR